MVAQREAFIRLCKALNQYDIHPMPLKGVLLQQTAYKRDEVRPCCDVDVMIQEHEYLRVVDFMKVHAYTHLGFTSQGAMFRDHTLPVVFDVHREPFGFGLFNLTTHDMFASGKLDRDLFGCSVVVPDPYLLYLHLLGHFAKGRMSARNHVHLLDLKRVPAYFELNADDAFTRIRHHDMERSSLYALTHLVQSASHHIGRRNFSCKLIGLLRRCTGVRAPTELALALARAPRSKLLGITAAHLLEPSLTRSLRAFALRMRQNLRRRT